MSLAGLKSYKSEIVEGLGFSLSLCSHLLEKLFLRKSSVRLSLMTHPNPNLKDHLLTACRLSRTLIRIIRVRTYNPLISYYINFTMINNIIIKFDRLDQIHFYTLVVQVILPLVQLVIVDIK